MGLTQSLVALLLNRQDGKVLMYIKQIQNTWTYNIDLSWNYLIILPHKASPKKEYQKSDKKKRIQTWSIIKQTIDSVKRVLRNLF